MEERNDVGSVPDSMPPPAARSRAAVRVLTALPTMFSGAVVVACLTFYNSRPNSAWAPFGVGPQRSWEEYLLVNITGLLLIPILALLATPNATLADHGLARPAPGAALPTVGLGLLMAPLLVVASRWPAFQAYYPMQPLAGQSIPYLIYFELTYGAYMLCWEFFYRGYLTFGLARAFGWWPAILVQSAAFTVMHYGKPLPELAGSFVAGVALGLLARRSHSCLPGFLLHWACAATFDVLVIAATPGGAF